MDTAPKQLIKEELQLALDQCFSTPASLGKDKLHSCRQVLRNGLLFLMCLCTS